MIKIEHRTEGSVSVITTEGNLTIHVIDQLNKYLKPFLSDATVTGVVINLEKSAFIDSTGLGVLVNVFKSLNARGATLVLCHMNPKFMEILENVGLAQLLKITDNEENALKRINS